MQNKNQVICPRCGKPGTMTAAKDRPGVIVLNCACTPSGPTLETAAPEEAAGTPAAKKEEEEMESKL
jgi:hypothetical protein